MRRFLAAAGLAGALNRIEAHSETTVMVGDRMDTDIVAGIEAGLDTILVLTGSTKRTDIEQYPYRPGRVLESIGEGVGRLLERTAVRRQ